MPIPDRNFVLLVEGHSLSEGDSPADFKLSVASLKKWSTFGQPEETGPTEGWKLHITAFPETAELVAKAIVPILIKHDVPHKYYLLPGRLEEDWNNKPYQQGKFIVVYPKSPRHVAACISLLAATLILCPPGPEVPNDRPLMKNRLYARYGEYRNGLRNCYIWGPGANKMICDDDLKKLKYGEVFWITHHENDPCPDAPFPDTTQLEGKPNCDALRQTTRTLEQVELEYPPPPDQLRIADRNNKIRIMQGRAPIPPGPRGAV